MSISRLALCCAGGLLLFGGAASAQSTTRCYIEGSVFGAAASHDLSVGPATATLGAIGGGISPGLGCDIGAFTKSGVGVFAGVLARYDWSSVHGNGLGFGSGINIDHSFDLAGRLGLGLTHNTNIFALGGWSWAHENSSLNILNANFNGPVVGGGLEHNLGRGLSLKLEYDLKLYNSQTLGFGEDILHSKGPNEQVGRLALVYSFGSFFEPLAEATGTYRPLK